ncbi:hypothetical protein Vretimale_11258 [Volvox reticuliferus]|uniref:Large ribosomal subunit protein bL9c n=2 Tax=Volvox reticuliferus TaxID=1737510 RepID=A0A8J4GGZ2_9CHLO|nr:hypothetical protein Vretimale_11258 [Volvox reticuliferus]
MQSLRIWALAQPGVQSLLGAARDAGALIVIQSYIPSSNSLERTAGVTSSSGLSATIGTFNCQSSFATVAAKGAKGALKERRGPSDLKEEDARLIRVVLRKDLKGLGRQGDVVHVKRGRMRHELYPGGDAAYATPENIAKYALTDAEKLSRDANAQEGVLEKLLRALSRKSVILTRLASTNDPERFVGPTVSPESIRKAVLRQLGIQLDPSHFLTEADIKTYGTFKVPLNLRLPDDKQVELTVHVDRRNKEVQGATSTGTIVAGRAS